MNTPATRGRAHSEHPHHQPLTKGRGRAMSQLTLAWAVNQSRRVFRAKKKQVHPEDVSSAGTDGGGSSYHGSPVKSRGVAIGNQRRAKKPGCLGALVALMGFGRGGSKVRAAARQMRQGARATQTTDRRARRASASASPLSRGGLLRAGAPRGAFFGRRCRRRHAPARPERVAESTSQHRRARWARGEQGTTASTPGGGMGYRDADEVSTRTSSRILDELQKVAVGSRRAAPVRGERVRGARRDARGR